MILNYTFIPRPSIHKDMYKMDAELSALLTEAHGILDSGGESLKDATNKDAFNE